MSRPALLATVAAFLLLLPTVGAAQDESLVLRQALHQALDGWPAITQGVPDTTTLRRRLGGDRATLQRLRHRYDALERQISSLDTRIERLQSSLTSDPGAMSAPRDELTLVMLQDRRETVDQFRKAVRRTVAATTKRVAREEVQLLAMEGGRAALEKRLSQLEP